MKKRKREGEVTIQKRPEIGHNSEKRELRPGRTPLGGMQTRVFGVD